MRDRRLLIGDSLRCDPTTPGASGWQWLLLVILASGWAACTDEDPAVRPRASAQAGEVAAALETALNEPCSAHLEQGQLELARDACDQLFREAQRAGDTRAQAGALASVGQALHALGDLQGALERYGQAQELASAAGDQRRATLAAHNLSILFGSLGRFDQQVQQLREVLEAHEPGPERALSTMSLGLALVESGEFDEGLATYDLAIRRLTEYDQTAYVALSHDLKGRLFVLRGQLDLAWREHQTALQLIKGVDAPPIEANIQLSLGLYHRARGACSQALEHLRQARAMFREQRNIGAVAEVLPEEARCLAASGDWSAAEALLEDAMAKIEAIRDQLARPALRGDFLSSRFGVYSTAIQLAMEQYARGSNEHAERAFDLNERARARTLLDQQQATAHRSIGEFSEEETRLHVRRRELERVQLRRRLQSGESDPQVDREIEHILQRLERQPAVPVAGSTPFDLATIQDEILDEETVLLSYVLSSEQSYLWWVEHDRLSTFELADGAEIDRVARSAHQGLATPQVGPSAEQLASNLRWLGAELLGPVAERLAGRRLLIVADGALHYLPFAVLTDPNGGQPLVERHEVVHLPSASFLVAQRRRLADRPPAPGLLAALGDPVFRLGDPRFEGERKSAETQSTSDDSLRALASLGFPELGRLVFTGHEVETIASLGPKEQVLQATGFDATRELLLSGKLGNFRIVHLATHGFFDASYPERSSLMLSLYDRDGQQIDGFVQAQDLQGLDLRAELVVLSACQTALGKEVRGEGLMGLTQAFFQAGAARQIVSFWRVPDRATSELMDRFYTALLEDGLAPAAALRHAQASMHRDGYSPNQWASMALLGDWRGF